MSKLLERIAPLLKFDESGFSYGNNRWSADLLYREAKIQRCRAEVFPLKFYDYSESPWSGDRICDYIYHARRIGNADKTIPIVISPFGCILDGYHRLAKALMDGDKSIMCYRLKEMPKPDGDCNA